MTAKDQPTHGQRRRGIQASRTKLVHALTAAGFKTQAALAEHIADREGLDAAPKDLVNRAFRELQVDPQTLDRIATALGVPAHTLYKASDDIAPSAPSPLSSPESPSVTATPASQRPALLALSLLTLVALAAAGWFYREAQSRPQALLNPQTDAETSTMLSLGAESVVVLPLENDIDQVLTTALRTTLSKAYNVATPTATTAAQSNNARELADKLRADLVISGDVRQVGHLSAVRVFADDGRVREQVWAQSLLTPALAAHSQEIAAHVSASLKAASPSQRAFFPQTSTQDEYLQGRLYLDQPTSELNVKRAQSRFSSAVRQQPTYARAHAGLCLALLEEFWMSDEERAISEAAQTCGDAMALAPNDSVVQLAHAYFLRRSGRNSEAVVAFQTLVEQRPHDAYAWDGLASALLDEYRQKGEQAVLVDAINAAERSVAANPDAWRPYNTLLSLNWFAGNIPEAIRAAQRALEFEETELLLVNLGTMQLCVGDLDSARRQYERAIEVAPGSYVGVEFLGQAMYFLGDFEQSVKLRKSAIESIAEGEPEIHEMWANLGDSFRQVGDTSGAIGAYLQASKIAERDHLRGNAAIADRASRAYYYTMLRELDRDTVSDEQFRLMRAELEDITQAVTETSALRRLAQTWLALGEAAKARDILAQVTATCPGYGLMPDLAELANTGD